MTEKELGQYKAIKNEIDDLNRRIKETKEGEVLQFGTVKGSSKYFPYTPKSFHVAGIDPADTKTREAKISELLRQREVQRDELVKKQLEMEGYINGVENSATRTILRLYYIDGLNQSKVARKVNYTQARVSQIIKSHFKKINKIYNKMC